MLIPKAIAFKGMTLEEFLELLEDKDVLDQTLSVREAKVCYLGSLPMMENVTITPQYSMSKFDFTEALVRCANIIYDSLDEEDENVIIPMLRPIDEDSPILDSIEMEAVASILDQFILDLITPTAILRENKGVGGGDGEGETKRASKEKKIEAEEIRAKVEEKEKNKQQLADSWPGGETYDDYNNLENSPKVTGKDLLEKRRMIRKQSSFIDVSGVLAKAKSGTNSGNSSGGASKGNSNSNSNSNSRGNSRGGNNRKERKSEKKRKELQNADMFNAIKKLEKLQ